MAKIQLLLLALGVSVNAISMDTVSTKEQRKRFRDSLVGKLDKMLDIEEETSHEIATNTDEPNGIIDCTICQTTVGYLDPMINNPKTRNQMEDFASYICAHYVQTHNSTVCDSATHMMGEIVVPSVTKFLLAPDYLCSERALGYCEYPKFEELKASDFVDE